jgi:hypothetical protein
MTVSHPTSASTTMTFYAFLHAYPRQKSYTQLNLLYLHGKRTLQSSAILFKLSEDTELLP